MRIDSWYIEEDHVDGDSVGQWRGEEDTLEECKLNCSVGFRLYNEDDLYYEGKCSENGSFDPLNDFDECTHIQYFSNGKWEAL